MEKFASHYMDCFRKCATRAGFAEGLVKNVLPTLAGATAGLGVADLERRGMNAALREGKFEPISGYGEGMSYGMNALIGGLAANPRTRGLVLPHNKSPLMQLAMTQVLQPALMMGDRGAKAISNLATTSGSISDAAFKVNQAMAPSNGTPGILAKIDHIAEQGDRIISDPRTKQNIQSGLAATSSLANSASGVADRVQSAMEEVSNAGRDLKDYATSPEGKNLVGSFGRAIDPRWMVGSAAAVGVPWLSWELYKRHRAKQEQQVEKDKQDRMLSAIERLAHTGGQPA
jgi:hypothetical protein